MTAVESYLVALTFVAGAGFSCGHGYRTMELFNTKQLGKSGGCVVTMFGLLSIPLLFVYAIRWGLFTDGPHFIWIPAILIGFFTTASGNSSANIHRNELKPWRLPIFGSIIVVASYYLFADYLTE